MVTCDETWVRHYEPEFKRQSMEWKHVGFPVKKFKSQQSKRKVMLTIFWDLQGPITFSFLQKGSTMSSANYRELLRQGLSVRRSHRASWQRKASHSSPNGADHQRAGLGTAPSSPLQPRPFSFRLSPVWSLESFHERHEV